MVDKDKKQVTFKEIEKFFEDNHIEGIFISPILGCVSMFNTNSKGSKLRVIEAANNERKALNKINDRIIEDIVKDNSPIARLKEVEYIV